MTNTIALALPDDTPVGIRCPNCNGCKLKAIFTRHRPGCTKRIRECKQCKHRIRTREVIESTNAPGRLQAKPRPQRDTNGIPDVERN